MGIRISSVQELARKALWAEVYSHAAELFASLAEETQEDPVETYNALFLSSYLFSLLGQKELSSHFKAPRHFQVGILRYSVTARLESIVVRGYSSGSLDLTRLLRQELTVRSRTELGAMVTIRGEIPGTYLIDSAGVFTGDYPLIE